MSRFLRRAPAPSTSVDKASLPISHDPILAPLPSTLASLQSRPPSAPLSAAQQDLLAALGAYVWELHGRGWEDDAELSKSRTVTETAGGSIEPAPTSAAYKAKESASAASSSTSPAPAWYRTWEETFLKDATTLPRYARASKWDLENAKKRISETLYWRRSYRPELISPDEVVEEAKTGKQVLSGFDKDGRPVLYLRPGRENTSPSPRQIRFLVYALERSLDIAPEGVETLTIIIDYKSATQASNPSLSQALKVLNILQSHYVERMGRAFVCNVPWYLNAFFSAISPFLDPATRAKIRFNAKLEEFVDLDLLDAEFGGRHRYVWDFDKYWTLLMNAAKVMPDGTRRVGARRAPIEQCTGPALSSNDAPTPNVVRSDASLASASEDQSGALEPPRSNGTKEGQTISRFLNRQTESAPSSGVQKQDGDNATAPASTSASASASEYGQDSQASTAATTIASQSSSSSSDERAGDVAQTLSRTKIV